MESGARAFLGASRTQNAGAVVLAVCNQKGGCGKTTTVVNLAAGLARSGKRVLVVDLDSQANATLGLGIVPSRVEVGVCQLLLSKGDVGIDDVVVESCAPGVHIAPASRDLAEFESRVASEIGRENRLKKALAPALGYYDVVLVDTPPSLGLLSINALNAAHQVLITLQAQPFAYEGLHLLLETVDLIREELNPRLAVLGVVLTMFDSRTRIGKEIWERVCSNPALEGKTFRSWIRQNIRIAESSKFREPVLAYDPKSPGSADYLALTAEILHALEAQHPQEASP